MLEYFAKRLFVGGTLLVIATIFIGCEKAKPTLSVSVHGVNYAADEFEYQLVDPDNPTDIAAAEEVNSFSGGGTMCCYPLPRQWRPGIHVTIKTTRWLPKDKDGNLPEVNEEHVAEVPAYADGKPGELWVIRALDGTVSVVSSDFQPDHERWPGKVKGWPVPSLEYRRARWQIVRDQDKAFVDTFVSLLRKLEAQPQKALADSWEFDNKNDKAAVAGFKGPDDPRYLNYLRNSYQTSLERSKLRLQQTEEARP